MVIDISGPVAVAVIGLGVTIVANLLAAVRVFHRLESQLAVIRTRIGYIERSMGIQADDETGL